MPNAELRDELERYVDESITSVNVQQLTLAAENDFLASMLAWEQITEKLQMLKRQAVALILREVHEGYLMPLAYGT